MEKHNHELGELRQDPITEKWVVIASARGKRPDDFAKGRVKSVFDARKIPKYKDDCPFCNAAKFPQEPDVLRLPDDPDTWQVHIFGNKYPAFHPREEFRSWNTGPYKVVEAAGYHEILATRWHNHFGGYIPASLLAYELEALELRYRQLSLQPSVNYIQIIKNQGPEAGGSIEHPHHQIFTVPVLPSDVYDLLHGAERYAKKHNEKAFTIVLDYERAEGTRIVWENEHFTVLCPFASRVPFETWILPRKSNPFFDSIGPEEREAAADALHEALGRIAAGLNNPAYNYYILSAPCDDTGFICDASIFGHYRWHIEILPRIGQWGGFELGTGLEINAMPPEAAAEFLRQQKAPEPIT